MHTHSVQAGEARVPPVAGDLHLDCRKGPGWLVLEQSQRVAAPLPAPTGLCSAQRRGLGGRELSHFTGENGVLERRSGLSPATQLLSIWGLGRKVLRPESTDTVW